MPWKDKSTNPAHCVIYSSKNCLCIMGFFKQSAPLSHFISIEHWFSDRGSLALQGTLGNVWKQVCFSLLGRDREVLLASGG